MSAPLTLIACALALVPGLWAEEAAGPKSSLPSLQVPYATQKPRVDAAAEDPAWQTAARIPRLVLHIGAPKEMQPVPTEVLLLWDEEFLYVRFVSADTELYTPFNGPDAPLYKGDVVEVFLDPKGDGRQYVEFEVSPDNSFLDSLHLLTAEAKSNEVGLLVPEVWHREVWSFLSWNLEMRRTAARALEKNGQLEGWVADFALPGKELLRRTGLAKFQPMTVRANFIRYEYAKAPNGGRQFIPMAWNPVQMGCPHVSPAAMGFLELKGK